VTSGERERLNREEDIAAIADTIEDRRPASKDDLRLVGLGLFTLFAAVLGGYYIMPPARRFVFDTVLVSNSILVSLTLLTYVLLLITVVALDPASDSRARNANCRSPCSRSTNNSRGPTVSSPSRNTNRGNPTAVASSNSNSVYDTSGLSRTGEPNRNPTITTYTAAWRTASPHTCAGASSRAVKYFISVTASPARDTASSAAATNERPAGSRRNSEV
jgi:hypothetical protein